MTIVKLLAAAACAASLVSLAGLARAQECPIADIGKTCSTGTCIEAKCTDTSADGAVARRDCAACVSLPPNACPPTEVGKACGNGGLCTVFGGGMGGGGVGPDGSAGPSQDIAYALYVCAAGPDDAASAPDAGTLGVPKGREDAAVPGSDDGGSPHAATQGAAPTASEDAGGCSTSAHRTGARGAATLALLAALLLMRRRSVLPAIRVPTA